ncbi:MAG: hypothetical protein II273_08870 [Lachnospiraceae bacterium]|nr:hypothetical protein [Lachnospiraceae bacterium]MEE1257280.1 hypothetical protein [Lachnospiraceae bacterium]
MTEKNHGREIAFVETYDEGIKGTIEKAFLNHGVSYLIKVDKVRDVKKGLFESKKKFSFYINRYQQDEARAAMQGKCMDEDKIMYLI